MLTKAYQLSSSCKLKLCLRPARTYTRSTSPAPKIELSVRLVLLFWVCAWATSCGGGCWRAVCVTPTRAQWWWWCVFFHLVPKFRWPSLLITRATTAEYSFVSNRERNNTHAIIETENIHKSDIQHITEYAQNIER